jgi:hypothetical protein
MTSGTRSRNRRLNLNSEVGRTGAKAAGVSTFVPLFQGNRSFEKASPRFLRQGVFISLYHTPCGPRCQGGQTSGLRPEGAFQKTKRTGETL